MNRTVSIVIPNYNGRALLGENLPGVIMLVEKIGGCEIIVVDDGSQDDSVAFLKKQFPTVRICELGKNQGFSAACNEGVKLSRADIVVLLNNDIKIPGDFITPLLKHFHDSEVFAVSPGIIDHQKGMNESLNTGIFERGLFDIIFPGRDDTGGDAFRKNVSLLYACGGAVAYDRGKFLVLDGFDEMFNPFYWEDVDISYRAWKRGWKIVYEAESKVFHSPGTTIKRFFKKDRAKVIYERNRLLFIWKNISDTRYLSSHLFWLPLRLLRSLFMNHNFLKGFVLSIRSLAQVIEKRRKEKVFHTLHDRDILSKVSKYKK